MNPNPYTYNLTYNFDGDRHWIMGMEGAVFEEVYARACLYRPDQINWRIVRSDGIQIAHHDIIDVKANLWKRMRVNVLRAEREQAIRDRIDYAATLERVKQEKEIRQAKREIYALLSPVDRLWREMKCIKLANAIAEVVLS